MMQSGYDGARKHATVAIVTLLVSTFTISIVPMVQQHWSDKAVAAEIKDTADTAAKAVAASEARSAAALAQQHADSVADRQALWQAISAIQTHTYAVPVTTAGQAPNASESLKRAAAAINAQH